MTKRRWQQLCIAAIVGVFVLSFFLPFMRRYESWKEPVEPQGWQVWYVAEGLTRPISYRLTEFGRLVVGLCLVVLPATLFGIGVLLLLLRQHRSALVLGVLASLGAAAVYFPGLGTELGTDYYRLYSGYFVWLASMVLLALAGACFAFLAKREPGLKTSARDSLRGGGMQGIHMQVRILQSGDDVSVVIPRALADAARLEPGAIAEASVEEGKLVVGSASKPKYTSEQLLTGITERNRRDEISSGPPVGEEVW